jgi:hypothetical protein
MSSSGLLILDGVTGAGKSSILRELVGFFSPSLQVISENRTLGNVISDSRGESPRRIADERGERQTDLGTTPFVTVTM